MEWALGLADTENFGYRSEMQEQFELERWLGMLGFNVATVF